MKKYINVTETVDVDIEVDITDYIDEFLDACSDDDIIKEAARRELNAGTTPDLSLHDDFRRFLCDILGFGYHASTEAILAEVKSKIEK